MCGRGVGCKCRCPSCYQNGVCLPCDEVSKIKSSSDLISRQDHVKGVVLEAKQKNQVVLTSANYVEAVLVKHNVAKPEETCIKNNCFHNCLVQLRLNGSTPKMFQCSKNEGCG